MFKVCMAVRLFVQLRCMAEVCGPLSMHLLSVLTGCLNWELVRDRSVYKHEAVHEVLPV